jgi:hypothetical protein
MKTLDDTLHKCFKKFRIKKTGARIGGAKTEVMELIMEKTKLSISLPSITCMLGKQIVENEILKLEEKISEISASRNALIVRDFLNNLDTSTGSFSQLGLWKLKNLLCPTQTDPPMAKNDSQGNLITAPNLVIFFYIETYKNRLRNR